MKIALLALVMALFSGVSFATGEDLARCRYNNGQPMEQRICDIFRKHAAKKAAEDEISKQQSAARRALELEQKAEYQAKQEQLQSERDARFAEQRSKDLEREKELEAMGLKARNEQIQWEKSTARAASERNAQQKALCGPDYRSPRIGMTVERAKECVADFKLKGQLNRKDGVVSTYTAGQTYLHVMDGRIVSWGK